QVTVDAFGGIVGAEHCEPSNIYISATVDQGGNMINAFRAMGVPTLICSGHRLNSAVQWATGIGGSFKSDGSGTCKNRLGHELVRKATAMVGQTTTSSRKCKKSLKRCASSWSSSVGTTQGEGVRE
ncbi:unnamed protein product, partial [Pylaiella littoralis]